MRIVKIEPNSNGSHNNQTGRMLHFPEGWAVVPEDLDTPNFPFGNVTVENIDGVDTVVAWESLPMPEPEPETEHKTLSVWDELDAAYQEGVNSI